MKTVNDMRKCENCNYYTHTPNILGGVAECVIGIKSLNVFMPNDACENYIESDGDKLKSQKQLYKENNMPNCIELFKKL